MDERELYQKLLGGYDGSEAEKERIWKILKEANVSGEYERAAYIIAETQAAAPHTTTAIQNAVGEQIHRAAQPIYQAGTAAWDNDASYGGRKRPSPAEFFARNEQARSQLYGTPIDLSFERWGADKGRILGQKFPEPFNQIKNVYQAMDYLTRTQAGSVWQQVTKPYRDAEGRIAFRSGDLERIGEEYNVGMEGGFNSLFGYNPMEGKGSVAVHFAANSYNAIRKDRKAEMDYKAFSGGSAAYDYEDSDFGYAVSGETGEYLGDTEMSAAEAGGRAFGDLGGWESPEVMPEGGVEAWQNWMLDQQNSPELDDTFADFDSQLNTYSRGYSLIGGADVPGRNAGTSRITNVDPNSRYALSGGQAGDQWRGMRQIARNKQLAFYMAAVENGMPINFNVQRVQNGALVDVPISIPGGPIFGGRTVDQMRQPNWVENLAGQIDKVPSYLYTTDERYAAGIYRQNGRWNVAPLSREPSKQFSVPVQFQPGGVRAFGAIYEEMNPVWDDWSHTYKDATHKAEDAVLRRARGFMANGGKYPAGWNYNQELTQEINRLLPETAPRLGTPEYQNYQNASLLLGELSDISGMFSGSTALEPEESTIELWDAVTSSLVRQVNPDAYQGRPGLGKSQAVNQTRRAVAEANPERAAEFLAQETAALYAYEVERLRSPARNPDPGGAPTPYQRLTANRGQSGPIFPSPQNAYSGSGGTFAEENFFPVGYGAPALTNKSFRTNKPNDAWFGPPSNRHSARPEWGDLPAVSDDAQKILSAYSASSNLNFIEAFPLGSMNEDDWGDWGGRGQRGTGPLTAYLKGRGLQNFKFRDRRERRQRTESTYDNTIMGGDAETPQMQEFLAQEILNDVNEYPTPRDFESLSAVGVDGANVVVMDPLIQERMQADLNRRYQKSRAADTDSEEFLEADISEKEVLSLIPDPESSTTSTANRIAGIGMRRGYYHTPWAAVSRELNEDNPDASWTYEALDKLDPKGRSAKLNTYLNIFSKTRKDLYMRTRLGEMPDEYRRFANAAEEGRGASYRTALRMISDEYKLGLSLEPGQETDLYDQLLSLSRDADPQKQLAYQAVKGQFAEPGEQYRAMLQYSTQVPAAAGPAAPTRMTGSGAKEFGRAVRAREEERQAREAERRALSHAYKAPGGRSMAKWSDADQFEMRRGGMSGTGINPETGEMNFDAPFATPPAARFMRPANPAGGPPEPPEEPPDFAGEPPEEEPENTPPPQRPANGRLDELQSKIHYTSLNDSRASSQVRWFLSDKNENGRTRFDVITNEKVSKGFLVGLQGLFAGEFDAAGYEFGNLEQVDDPSLPAGYTRWGGRVTASNGVSSAGSSNQAAPTPQPARPPADTDPANFPMQPGGEGWKMTFSRYDPKTKHGAQVSAWGRKNDQGELGWYVRNENGEMEPLQINKGWGKVFDEKGTLLNDVSRDARDYYDNMNAPIASNGSGPSGAGNSARTIIEDPAQFPEPAEGRMLRYRPQSGGELYLHAAQDPNSGDWGWAARSTVGGGNELVFRQGPGYGEVTENGQIIANVSRAEYERYQGAQATVLPKEAPPSAARSAPPPLAPARTQLAAQSQAFSRFNLALNDANAAFSGRLYASADGNRYGINPDDKEGFRRGIANEFFDKVAASWNQFSDNPAASVEDVVDALTGNLGVDEELVRPAAQLLYDEQQRLERYGHQKLAKEGALRAGTPRRARDALNMQDGNGTTGRGAPGWRALAQDRVSTMNIDYALADFSSPSLGVAIFTSFEDSQGITRSARNIAKPMSDETFAETVSPADVAKAVSMGQKAYTDATSGALPQGDPDAIAATVKQRMYASLQKQMLEEIDKGVGNGMSKTDATAHAEIVREVAEHITKKAGEEVKKSLGETEGETSAASGERHDSRVANVKDAQALLDRSPRIRQALGSRSLQEVMDSRDETIVLDESDRQFSLGGPSGARYAGGSSLTPGQEHIGMGGRNGLFGGRYGSLFYGAYMLKREWQMSAQPVIQRMAEYEKSMGELSPLTYDSGEQMSGTIAGALYRQEMGEEFMQRSAYSAFGSFMDIPYRLSQGANQSAGRLLSTAGMAGGIAAGGFIGGGMLGAMAMPAAGATMMTGGAAIGGALLAGVGAMEVYNNFFRPEEAPEITPSKILDDFWKQKTRDEANKKRIGDQIGNTYEEYLAKPGRMHAKMSEQEWGSAWREEVFNTPMPSDDELQKWMSPDQKELFANESQQKEAQSLKDQLNAFRGETGEDLGSLTKAALFQKQIFGAYDTDKLQKISRVSAALGVGSAENLSQAATYAGQMGLVPGTPEYEQAAYEFAELDDREVRARKTYTGGRWAQMGAQWQAYMSPDGSFAGAATRLGQQYGLDTQAEASAVGSMAGALTLGGQNLTLPQQERLAQIVAKNGPRAAMNYGQFANMVMASSDTMTPDQGLQLMDVLSGAGMSVQQSDLLTRMAGGDLGAYAFNAWKTGDLTSAFNDQAGRPILQHEGAVALGVYNKWAPQFGGTALTGTPFQQADQLMGGGTSADIINAFLESGTFGMQRLANEKSYAASMASIGVQLKGIALSENFYWGSNAGGTWDHPTSGSAWGIEDRQIAAQRASQEASFAEQWQRMNAQNQFGIEREQNQQARMNLTAGFQSWQWSANYNQFQQQQAWARQDWQFQDTQRGLQYGWQMEDLDEAIRFSSGRERRQLVKQRDRAALSHNMEEEQVDTQRKRQEELWAAQDERYKKEREYTLENQKLDQESFNLNKRQREEFFKMDVESYDRRRKEYEEEKKLQDELQALQHKFQYDQLQLQKEAAGAQAAVAAAQKEINDRMITLQENWEKHVIGPLQETLKYDKGAANVLAVKTALEAIGGVPQSAIDAIVKMVTALNNLDTTKLYRGIQDVEEGDILK